MFALWSIDGTLVRFWLFRCVQRAAASFQHSDENLGSFLVLGVTHTEDLRLIQHAELGDRVPPPPRLSRQRTRRGKL